MNFSEIMTFKGQWRSYQARVLSKADNYLCDGKIHIVAAPGSGKTTLGIELLIRLNKPALILAPSVTIREQWEQRIKEVFLNSEYEASDYISQSLKNPKLITISTYQSLHSAMNKVKDSSLEQTDEEEDYTEKVDYSDFDVIKMAKQSGFGVLCLDECHHLRNEWWKSLEAFRSKLGDINIIALTATPPYDSSLAMWNRYIAMCGEIDEEITVPELVKEGSLCPHQDYVYFNYPTKEESKLIKEFTDNAKQVSAELMKDIDFIEAIMTHRLFNDEVSDEELLENPERLSALLIFLKTQGIPYPKKLQQLLGAKKIPDMDNHWLQVLLQMFLYDDTTSFSCDEVYREKLLQNLKVKHLVEKRHVVLEKNETIEKILITSKAKCDSIVRIASHEFGTLGNDLRMLILTDYIRKEYLHKSWFDEGIPTHGVVPFFEKLRLSFYNNKEFLNQPRLGVLSGSLVIIPLRARERLIELVGNEVSLSFEELDNVPGSEYLVVSGVNESRKLVSYITKLFSEGEIQILIGTKSLLGEGWDSPCINSLILASFVGSYMLSNQMRGRAIRVFKDVPDKTSNIWHLVCIPDVVKSTDRNYVCEDLELLMRRMNNYLGLHYSNDTIENGMERLSFIGTSFTPEDVDRINRQMLGLSSRRYELKDRWMKALDVHKKMEVVSETEVSHECINNYVFKRDVTKGSISGILTASVMPFASALALGNSSPILQAACVGAMIVGLGYSVKNIVNANKERNPYRRLEQFGKGIQKALIESGKFDEKDSKVVACNNGTMSSVYLSGGSGRDNELFATCINEFFAVIDNQRYILVKNGNRDDVNSFYCVPDIFSKRKEDAVMFANCLIPFIGDYDVVYTRNEEGRKLLLEGRMKGLANIEYRSKNKKKVKSCLE